MQIAINHVELNQTLLIQATTFRITSTHYGPHHGAQANVFAGVGFAEIAGSIAYPAAGSATHVTALVQDVI